jgi:hypothetical protein
MALGLGTVFVFFFVIFFCSVYQEYQEYVSHNRRTKRYIGSVPTIIANRVGRDQPIFGIFKKRHFFQT